MIVLRIILILLLQTLVLGSMIGMKEWTLQTGVPVVLETTPIDPRSLFSGDYVRLNYAISAIPYSKLVDKGPLNLHDELYVLLKAGTPYWDVVSVYRNKPEVLPFQVLLKGEVFNTANDQSTINLKYGIENYYVPEGKGRELEHTASSKDAISVRIVVDKLGNAGIKAVLVNGKERYVETLF